MLFREVLGAVKRVLSQQTWLEQRHAVYVVRDLKGQIRVLVETHSRDDPGVAGLRSALAAAIGRWLADHEPVVHYGPGVRDDVLKALVRLLRGSPDWPGHQGPFKLHLLERHAGKRGWVGDLSYTPSWPRSDVDQGQRPPVITFFSQKGGVGRSTALVATALQLTRKDKSVVVVDLDLEAPGLGTMLLEREPDNGLIDWLVNPDAVTDLLGLVSTVDEPMWVGGGKLRVLPAGRLDEGYLQMLARVDFQASQDPKGLQDSLADLFRKLVQDEPIDAILVDARAGLHEVGGVMLAALSHLVVFVGTTNEQSWFGLETVAKLLGRDRINPIPLLVAQGLAGDEAGGAQFRRKVFGLLSDHYYPSPPPDEMATHWPHSAIRLLREERLYGQGGLLNSEVIEVLTGPRYQDLAARLIRQFPALEAT